MPSRGILGNWLPLCALWHGDIKCRPPPADLLSLAMDNWECLDSLDWATVISEGPDRHYGIRQVHLLPLGHQSQILNPEGVWVTYLSFSPHYCQCRGTTLHISSDLTTQLYFQVYSSHSFIFDWTNLPYVHNGKKFLAKVGASIWFSPPVCLTSDTPAPPLILPAIQPNVIKMSFPLSAFQLYPEFWDTQIPSVARHHFPILIQL